MIAYRVVQRYEDAYGVKHENVEGVVIADDEAEAEQYMEICGFPTGLSYSVEEVGPVMNGGLFK